MVPISDNYKSSAFGTDLCSSTLQREISHGHKKVIEKTEFDQKNNQAHRQTMVPAGGGKSDFGIPTCGRDALTFQYLARREMGQGRVPPARQGILRLGLRREDGLHRRAGYPGGRQADGDRPR